MFTTEGFQPWRDFGERAVWNDPANPHNPMLDATGRVWMTTRIRHPDNPAWCRDGSDNEYAKYFPVDRSGRHTGYYDPETETFVLIDTCFGTHHLQFAENANDTLYFSGGGSVIGWIDTKVYDETGDERFSQGWCPQVLDTNGDGDDHEAVERAAAAREHERSPVRSVPRHPRHRRRLRHHRQPRRRRRLDRVG